MTQEQEKKKAFDRAQFLVTGFSEAAQNRTRREGRRQITAEEVETYLTDLLRTLGQYSGPDAPRVELPGLWIQGDLVFPNATYPPITMSGTKVDGVTFEKVVFAGNCDFSALTVAQPEERSIHFRNVEFHGDVIFNGAVLGQGGFEHVTFNVRPMANGGGARFFQKCIFNDGATLQNFVLQSLVDCEFHGNATNLRGTKGLIPFIVERCTFFGTVEWDGSDIYSGTIRSCGFKRLTSFNGVQFNEKTLFDGLQFEGECLFNKTQFRDSAHFRNVSFKRAPEFYEAKLFPDTTFYTSKFFGFKSEADWAAYRQLRHHAIEQMKSPAEEGRFFLYEQRTRANLDLKQRGNRFAGAISKMYDIVSNYGQNVFRPLALLVLLNIAITVLYAQLCSQLGQAAGTVGLNPAIGFSVQNIFSPFAFLGKQTTFFPKTGTMVALGISQSLLTLALFALWVLAVRRRLRKGSE